MKKLTFAILAIIVLAACSNKSADNKNKEQNGPTEWKHYSSAWFDFDYPSYLIVEKEERNEVSDTMPGFKDGGEVILSCDYPPYRLRFVKSTMFDIFDTPEEWRDFSINLKDSKNDDESDSEVRYLGVYETQDSLKFHGHPAASVVFAVLEGRDTVAHYQMVVLTEPSKNLYYLNYKAPLSIYEQYWETADSIINTVELK